MSHARDGVRDHTNIVPEKVFSGLVTALVGARLPEQNMIAVPAEDADAHATIAALRTRITDMQADWDTLNEFLNTTAERLQWCSEYEQRVANYNEHFRVLTLTGRPPESYGPFNTWTTTDGRMR